MTLPVSSNLPITSLTTTNGIPIVSLTTTNGLPLVSLTTTNGLPIVTLSTASFPGIGEATTKDNVVVVATTIPTSTRVQASPSFSLISPSSATLITVTTRVTTVWTPGPSTTLVFPKTTSTRRRTTILTSTRRVIPTTTRRVIATSTRRAPVVTVTVTRRPGVIEPEPTVIRRPPWVGRPGRVGPPRRGPWAEDEE